MNDVTIDFGPAVVPLNRIVVGDDVVFSAQIVKEDNTPFDLSSVGLIAEISRIDNSVIATFTIGSGISVSGNAFEWLIPASVTSLLNPCFSYKYEIVMIKDGLKRTLLDGPVRVYPD